MRPIDADAFKKYIDAQEGRPFIGCTVGEAMKILIDEQPTIQPEPTDEQVAEYCKKRCLHLVTNDFFRIGKIEVNEVGHDESE